MAAVNNLEIGLIEVGYFLSRLGLEHPPINLRTTSWKEAYGKFYSTFGLGKTEVEFKNSLKNLRDHFDSHLENPRVGWRESNGTPQRLSAVNQQVFDELQKLDDRALWRRIEPYVTNSYDLKLSNQKIEKITSGKAKFFASEFTGFKNIKSIEARKAVVNHGSVVDYLKVFSEKTTQDSFAYNTQKIDLALEISGELRRIYEVKTSIDTQSIYTAVGQLFMHSVGAPEIEKWIVLPGPILNERLLECLDRLNITLLCYYFENEICEFIFNK